MPTALITGASAGLGAEFARQLARRGSDLVLVARSTEALQRLASEIRESHGVAVEVLTADLTDASDLARVEAVLADPSDPIDLLINNAGFGLPRSFDTNPVEVEVGHLRLHVEAPLRLMHAVLPVMRRRGGRIINVASVAAFVPRSTYAACKAWLVSFSRWANVEYRSDNVTVTALCPGFTRTSFHENMGYEPGDEGVPRVMWLDAARVVREGLSDAARGKAVSVPSLRYKIAVAATRIIPPALLAGRARRGRF